ncbi:MAG: bacillithiol system redox-active protein YtxJ [Balneolaceae bacterium]
MSFLNGLRGMAGGKPELNKQWKIPETTAEVDELFESGSGLDIIYKHSYSCGTCIFAKTRVETILEELSGKAVFHFVDVHANRPVSNYIAEKSGIRHESPQLIILYNGGVFWHGSHNDVHPEPIKKALVEVSG